MRRIGFGGDFPSGYEIFRLHRNGRHAGGARKKGPKARDKNFDVIGVDVYKTPQGPGTGATVFTFPIRRNYLLIIYSSWTGFNWKGKNGHDVCVIEVNSRTNL